MQAYAEELRREGFTVDAAWLTGEMGDLVGKTSRPEGDPEAVEAAKHDVADIRAADVAVIFIDAPGPNNRGGYHVEFGIALERRIPLLLVGNRVNSFNHLPEVQFHSTWETAKTALLSLVIPEGGHAIAAPMKMETDLESEHIKAIIARWTNPDFNDGVPQEFVFDLGFLAGVATVSNQRQREITRLNEENQEWDRTWLDTLRREHVLHQDLDQARAWANKAEKGLTRALEILRSVVDNKHNLSRAEIEAFLKEMHNNATQQPSKV